EVDVREMHKHELLHVRQFLQPRRGLSLGIGVSNSVFDGNRTSMRVGCQDSTRLRCQVRGAKVESMRGRLRNDLDITSASTLSFRRWPPSTRPSNTADSTGWSL